MRSRVLTIVCLAASVCASAQELAHRGWRGNGIAPESWWRHATFVRFGPEDTYADVASTLGDIAVVGADSLILADPEPQPGALLPFDDSFGSEGDLDGLLREASARRLHVLLRVPLHRIVSSPDELRFWLSRGVAGFDVGSVGPADADGLHLLRIAMDHYPGQRILLARTQGGSVAPQAFAVSRRAGTAARRVTTADPVTLHIISAEEAEVNHPANPTQLIEIIAQPAAAVEQPAANTEVTLPDSVPTLRSLVPLLLAPGAPILDSRLLTTPGDRDALQKALGVRNTHPVLRGGSVLNVINEPTGLRGWVLQGNRSKTQERLLLIENNAAQPMLLRMREPLVDAGVPGSYVRPLLRSDGAMGAVNLDTGTLPAGAAILGEIGNDSYSGEPTAQDLDAPPPGRPRTRRQR